MTAGGFGGYADQVVVDGAEPFPVPGQLSPGAAVALIADGRTAIALVRAAAIGPGDRVLVSAAAGGGGSLLVQLARRAGARTVVAVAGSPHKLAQAPTLGADVAVDHSDRRWTDEARAATRGSTSPSTGSAVGSAAHRREVPDVAGGRRPRRHGSAGHDRQDPAPTRPTIRGMT